jgi:hypothetical protein
MNEVDSRDLGFSVVRRGPDGIVEVRIKSGAIIELAEMERILEAQESLLHGMRSALTLVDARAVRSMTRAAQELSANAVMATPQKGVAILVANPVSVMLGNIFMLLSTPVYPTRLFRSEEEARAWLLAQDAP